MCWLQRAVQAALGRRRSSASAIQEVNHRREGCARLTDLELDRAGRRASTLSEVVAVTAVVASRVLGLTMFDEQIQGALGLAQGRVVEMQTGEGKTLAAVPAIAWLARSGQGVHVLTANDYLAARDAEWMGGVYRRLGLSVAAIGQASSLEQRREAYRADITYATANEIGFDHLRDGLVLEPADRVQRDFFASVVDEADSILLDEARIPLVIAGGTAESEDPAVQADRAVRDLVPRDHYTIETHARSVLLTPAGVTQVERALGCTNLYDASALRAHTAVQDALHAHALLRRDVDYVVSDGRVLPVDEFKGRIVQERRWPGGLQEALEVKEGVPRRASGRVLGSITVEHLIAQYKHVCGMTGTAATQADEFREVYGLDVEVIPTHRPIARVDHADEHFATRAEKELAVQDEIRRVHATGRPVLVGTASVEESERLSRALCDLPHHVLNARNEAAEAAIVARAGRREAVTISTNMAGRGVDIRLGDGVAALGGLYVIGTNRHESRRIDHQLRGRAGRQGDPGSARFFVSGEDPLIAKYGRSDDMASIDHYQRVAEGQNLDIRIFLRKYEHVIEGQRLKIALRRQAILTSAIEARGRHVRLATIDDLWSDYLAAVAELRSGTPWISLGYGNAIAHYLGEVHRMFGNFEQEIVEETEARLADPAWTSGRAARQRGATWTYLTTDDPFGPMTARILARLRQLLTTKGRTQT